MLIGKTAKIMWLKISRATLTPFSFCTGGRRIRDAGACRLNSAYHASWSGACAGGLAPRGLNGARSLWHDMSWTFACALCFSTLSGWGGGGAERGWGEGEEGPLQVAPEAIGVVRASLTPSARSPSPPRLAKLGLKWAPDMAARKKTRPSARWLATVGVKGRFDHFDWRSLKPVFLNHLRSHALHQSTRL